MLAGSLREFRFDCSRQSCHVVFTGDICDPPVFADDNIDREGIQTLECLGERHVVLRDFDPDWIRHLEIARVPLNACNVIRGSAAARASSSSGIDSDNDESLVAILFPELSFDVWQLQTADWSESGEVGQQLHLVLRSRRPPLASIQ